MNLILAEKVANAVLYEGYILYPYRPSAVKNRQRWTFGGIYPQAFSEAQGDTDPCVMQTECLVEGNERTALDIRVRFLHIQDRSVGALDPPLADLPVGAEPPFRPVAELRAGGRIFQTWQESVEREVVITDARLGTLLARPLRQAFAFPAAHQMEPIQEPGGPVVGLIVRRQEPLAGAVEVTAEGAAPGVFKVTVRIRNLSPLDDAGAHNRDAALLHTFASAHTFLGVRDGAFVSLLEPPAAFRELAAGCSNVGTWPVLIGTDGEHDLLLSSPIILYDYPEIAPESPGDLYDGAEIDEILSLRILTLTDDEKQEMRAVDVRARDLLERTEALQGEDLMRLHGAIRTRRPLEGGR